MVGRGICGTPVCRLPTHLARPINDFPFISLILKVLNYFSIYFVNIFFAFFFKQLSVQIRNKELNLKQLEPSADLPLDSWSNILLFFIPIRDSIRRNRHV